MILIVLKAIYVEDYKILLTFNSNQTYLVDLKDTILQDERRIFQPLRDIQYFSSFQIKLNTITWENEADFAPEFLLELGQKQTKNKLATAC